MKSKMRIQSLSIFFLLLSVIIILSSCKVGVQEVVREHYENNKGLIQNYGGSKSKQKREYLSESIGQYMYYLVLIKDEKTFSSQVDSLKEHFIVTEGDQLFIKWRVTKSTVVNASIDDFRIIESLKKASKEFNEPSYLVLANKLEETIISTQLTDGLVVDFYDWKLKKKTSEIHLSYLNDTVIKGNKALDTELYQKIVADSLDTNSPYFNEVYDVEKKTYETANKETVNLIDQFLIAINYIKMTNKIPREFDQWLRDEWTSEQKLAGGYNKQTLSPSVEYESSAVYSMAILYFITVNEPEYAKQVHEILMEQPPFSSEANYEEIHFFDYMWAKTSDWEYKKMN